MKFISFFTGGGGADIGAQMAGLDLTVGYEYVPEIAAHAEEQLKHKVYCQNILDLDPANIPPADFAHFSPPCPAFSVANNNKGETENDILLALKMAEIITVKKYKYLTIENVWGYRKSESWRIISSALNVVYGLSGWDVNHVNFADHFVPQTRKRMIVRAIKDKIILPLMPQKQKWIGWYEAIEDLIPTLPDSQFAPWQIERLKNSPIASFLVSGQMANEGAGVSVREESQPGLTVTKSHGNQQSIRAYLVDGVSYDRPIRPIEENRPSMVVASGKGGREPKAFLLGNGTRSTEKELDQPSDTITSHHNQTGVRAFITNSTDRGKEARHSPRTDKEPMQTITTMTAWKGGINGRIVAMTPRALARFQTFPDWYELPKKKTLATTITGNAVPPVGYAEIVRSMINE